MKNMKTHKFKTNINCGGCIAKVTPYMDQLSGVEKWAVDVADPKKVLSVSGDVSATAVMETIKQAGFEIEEMKSGFKLW